MCLLQSTIPPPARDLRRFLFYAIHHRIEPPPPSSSVSGNFAFLQSAPALSTFSPFRAFRPFRAVFLFSPLLPSPSFSLFWAASLHCQNESLRRDLNSSLPAPFPDFSSVKSAPRRAAPSPRFSSGSPRQFVRIRPCPIIGSRYYHNCPGLWSLSEWCT